MVAVARSGLLNICHVDSRNMTIILLLLFWGAFLPLLDSNSREMTARERKMQQSSLAGIKLNSNWVCTLKYDSLRVVVSVSRLTTLCTAVSISFTFLDIFVTIFLLLLLLMCWAEVWNQADERSPPPSSKQQLREYLLMFIPPAEFRYFGNLTRSTKAVLEAPMEHHLTKTLYDGFNLSPICICSDKTSNDRRRRPFPAQ